MLSGEPGPLRALGALGGLAFVMAALAVLGWLLGAYLDRRLGTTPWLSIVGTLAGTAAGFFELITVLRRSERTDSEGRGK
jgi:ATP synthase protein I